MEADWTHKYPSNGGFNFLDFSILVWHLPPFINHHEAFCEKNPFFLLDLHRTALLDVNIFKFSFNCFQIRQKQLCGLLPCNHHGAYSCKKKKKNCLKLVQCLPMGDSVSVWILYFDRTFQTVMMTASPLDLEFLKDQFLDQHCFPYLLLILL